MRPKFSFEFEVVTVGGKEGQRLARAQAASILEVLDWISHSPQKLAKPPENLSPSDWRPRGS